MLLKRIPMELPVIHNIEKIAFPKADMLTLANKLSVYGFNGVKNDIIRLDLVFNSGRWTEPAPLVAECVAKLFKSGTPNLTAYELNEQIEQYGSTIRATSGYNTFTVSVYCLTKFLEPTLQLLNICLTEIIFPIAEIELLQKNALARLKVSKEKNDYLADVAFRKNLFGEHHPYGYETTNEAITQITQEKLIHFYQTELHAGNATLFIAGNYTDKELSLIEQYLGAWKTTTATKKEVNYKLQQGFNQSHIRIKQPKSVQASIIIGKEFFNKHDNDYASFVLLNTIFGGYFGSRLMSNIREEKGLTYGIHSSLSTLKYSGIFSIQTETNLENLDLCLKEIYLEIERLQNELISEQEITLARNYLLGKFLGRTDGAFNQIEVFKSYFIENLPINKFEEIVETIRQTNALSLQQLAQKYLTKERMCEIVVG